MKPATEILATLPHFTGTQHHHRWSSLFPDVITDGVLYLAESAECFWLLDAIASHQVELKAEHFQVWTLHVTNTHSAVLLADDGNGRTIARQPMGYTDFPLESIKLYAVGDGARVTIMLPSEY